MTEPKRNEIISRWRAGSSIRKIAREMGLARNTVSRVLAQIEAQRSGHEGSPIRRRPSRLDHFEPFIQGLLSRYPDLTAVRLLEELRERGFTGGYTTVRQRLNVLRPRRAPLPVVRFETAQGAQAQMDYAVYDLDFTSEGRRRVNLFSYLLGYSRRQYLRFVEAQDMTTTLREHLRAFEHLGGVAANCLYDNMKVVVTGYEDDVPIYNSRFLAFATHYGFRPVACRPRRAQTKGKVERPFSYVETSLFNGRTFSSLDHLNEMTAWWLAHVADVRQLREAKNTPLQLHADEQPHLIPLPAQPYDVSPVVYRTVNVEALVTYCQNGYSVPWRYIGSMLPVRITEKELIVYGPQVEEIELGEPGRRFLEGLFQVQRYGKDQAQRVLALLGTYAQADLIAALERAVRYGAYSHAAVERILSAQARPKTILEALAEEERRQIPPWLGEDLVSPRPTSVYQDLCESEPHDAEKPPTASDDAGSDGTAPADH